MKWCLIESPENFNEQTHQLSWGVNTIGRGLDNNIVFVDKTLSRSHAEIIITNNTVVVKDLDSLNHTFVNEFPIREKQIENGDMIRFGNVLCKFVQTEEEIPTAPVKNDNLSILSRIFPCTAPVGLQDLLKKDDEPKLTSAILKLKHKDQQQRALDKLKILLEISRELSSPQNLEELLENILELLFKVMDFDRAAILLVDNKSGDLEEKAVRFKENIASISRFYSTTITNYVRETEEGILTSNACSDKRFASAYSVLLQNIQASMCVPLKPKDELIGVLYADNLSLTNVYSDEDLEFLYAVGTQSAIAIENSRLYQQLQAEALMRGKLEIFFPEPVMKKIKEEGISGIIDTEVTILFADITSYTELSSCLEPKQVIEMLNEYFTIMVEEIIFTYEGTLEKYIGDALLAVWGAPYQQKDDADRALKAAIDMQKAVNRLNKNWSNQGRNLEIQIHIGLNTGRVAAGNIGSKKLIQYATIGDTTNVCSRVCGVAQAREIIITQSTFDKLIDISYPLEKLSPVQVKGKAEPLQLYRVNWQDYNSHNK